jgi:aryl-alcohol dehydrogenase-like predicted oxidoreductase
LVLYNSSVFVHFSHVQRAHFNFEALSLRNKTMEAKLAERRLGKSGPVTGPVGVGTWAIGGPFYSGQGCDYPTDAPLGYGQVVDKDSTRAIHCAIDLGAILFDTADAYGTGHAERILGEALKNKRY